LERNFTMVARTAPSLGNLRELLDEFVFVDDEKMIGISINPRLRNLCMKKLIRGRVAYHLGQFFMEISVQCGWNKVAVGFNRAELPA
jgi:hypothetical protein